MAHNKIAERLEGLREELKMDTVQEFVDRLNKHLDDPIPYATARRYHRDREPPVTYLAAVSRVFGAPLEWLVFGAGAPTEKHDRTTRIGLESILQQQEEMHAPSDGEGKAFVNSILERMNQLFSTARTDSFREKLTGLPSRPSPPDTAYWAAPLAEVELRLWLTDTMEPTRGDEETDHELMIAEALGGPMKAFGVNPARMKQESRVLGEYIVAMVPALLSLARERDRQRREPSLISEENDEANEGQWPDEEA